MSYTFDFFSSILWKIVNCFQNLKQEDKRMKKVVKLRGALLLLVIALVACGTNTPAGKSGKNSNKDVQKTQDISKFLNKVENEGKAIKGGTLEAAVITDTPFKGIFSELLYQDSFDATFMSPSHESLFASDENFKITDKGAAVLDFNQEEKTAKITLKDDVKWSDGVEVTADDIIYAYEVLAHPDYTGVRYDDKIKNIIGAEDYHEGLNETISGIKKLDEGTVQIEYKEVNPGMLYAGGIYGSAVPKHLWKDIPVKELDSSDIVRKNPISFGPFQMSKIVPGEFVEYTPNSYYYRGKSKLDKVILTSVPSVSIAEALKAKKYDLALGIPTDIYETYKDVSGYQILGRQELSYSYIGFKLGVYDQEKKQVEVNPDAKMADVNLRQAMGYAVDNKSVAEKFYNGLRSEATTLIPPIFDTLHNKDIKGYKIDLEKANQLLDDAGYLEKDEQGYRKKPNGEELVINFASMAGGETAQPMADYYVQQWKEIGLNVQLTTGRLIDFQVFYDKLKNDDPEVDVYQAAWGVGMNPSPSGLYSRVAQFNYPRYADETTDKLLKAIDSSDSFDETKRKKAFDEWQEYMFEQAIVIPTLYRDALLPVSNRVKSYDFSYEGTVGNWGNLEVTSDKR